MSYQPNESITDVLYHGDTGKVNGDFTKRLYLDGVTNDATVTITEIANGYYKVQFTTDDGEGVWALAVEEGTLKWEESYLVQDPADYKATGFSVPNEYDAVIAALQADLDNPSQYKATGFSVPNEYDTVIAALQTDLDNPAQYKANVSALALEATVAALNNISSANVTTACTSSLNTYDPPTRAEATTDKNAIITEVDANETKIDAVQADLDNPNQYKADVSGLAPSGEYDSELAAIQADLDDPAQYKANVANLDAAVSSRSSHTAANVNSAVEAGQVGQDASKTRKFVSNRAELDNDNDTYDIYEDDGSTPGAYTGAQTTTSRVPD